MSKQIILSHDAPQPVGPYSQAVAAGGFVFLAGQIPIDPAAGSIVAADTPGQTRRVLENMRAVLAAAGLGFGDVVKTTVFMVDLKEFGAMNQIYSEYFGAASPPARSTVQVAALPLGARVEIEAVAIAKG